MNSWIDKKIKDLDKKNKNLEHWICARCESLIVSAKKIIYSLEYDHKLVFADIENNFKWLMDSIQDWEQNEKLIEILEELKNEKLL